MSKSDKAPKGGKKAKDKLKASKGAPGKPGKARVEAKALARSPSHLLHRALQLALDVYAAETGSGAVTQRQYAVLAAVSASDTPSQTDLVRMTGIDRSTLAELISRMIAKGLLGRERSATDGRANHVRPTDAGREAMTAAAPKVQAADARILSVLGGGQREAFLDALAKLARAGETALVVEAAEPVLIEGPTPEAPKPRAPKAKPATVSDADDAPAKTKPAATKPPKPKAAFPPPKLVAPD
ncbi:MarR family transcriptional regulator [soil metagenome]